VAHFVPEEPGTIENVRPGRRRDLPASHSVAFFFLPFLLLFLLTVRCYTIAARFEDGYLVSPPTRTFVRTCVTAGTQGNSAVKVCDLDNWGLLIAASVSFCSLELRQVCNFEKVLEYQSVHEVN
jgi:hypothetical protein